MRILFAASEVDPFAKTGGLADVAGALPKALATLGHDVRVVAPLYRPVSRTEHGLRPTAVAVRVPMGSRALEGRVWEGCLPARAASAAAGGPNSRVTIYFIEQADLFDRDGLYQIDGLDYPDNLERFSFFSQALLQMLPRLAWHPEVLHSHDWQAALACAHLAWGPMGRDPFYAAMGTVFTIHNVSYQGIFPTSQWALTGLPESAYHVRGLEFYGQINCLKGALVSADVLTSVSPTYAEEIQTTAFGCGLEGVLRGRRSALTGILNGIDSEAWDPRTDALLPARYGVDQLAGKALCKLALQRQLRLPERHDLLIGMVQRLVEQKGLALLTKALEPLMRLPLQLVILGTGERAYEEQLEQAAKAFPDRLAVRLAFDNALAHQIEAGADAFLMPSRFEPCGLNQMYSMRYGTVPIVRRVGGLADTVIDVSPATATQQTATGFTFEAYTAKALLEAVKRSVTAFRDRPLWMRVMQAGMQQDFSWDRAARAYVAVYERALGKAKANRLVARG